MRAALHRHKTAVIVIISAFSLDMVLGLLFSVVENVGWFRGVYWALATATTVGYGDVYPHSRSGRIIAVIAFMTVIPLFGATFSLFTTSLTAEHVHNAKEEIKEHVSQNSCNRRDEDHG